MARSKWKAPVIDYSSLKLVTGTYAVLRSSLKSPIKTMARTARITPDYVGHFVGIYNGRSFKSVAISSEMVNYKLGEFSFTRRVAEGSVIHARRKGIKKK